MQYIACYMYMCTYIHMYSSLQGCMHVHLHVVADHMKGKEEREALTDNKR
jgi:hypothetical protein